MANPDAFPLGQFLALHAHINKLYALLSTSVRADVDVPKPVIHAARTLTNLNPPPYPKFKESLWYD